MKFGLDPSFGAAAELLHRSFLKNLLGAQCPLLTKLHLQSLVVSHCRSTFGYHHRVAAVDNSRLVMLAMVDGCIPGANQCYSSH